MAICVSVTLFINCLSAYLLIYVPVAQCFHYLPFLVNAHTFLSFYNLLHTSTFTCLLHSLPYSLSLLTIPPHLHCTGVWSRRHLARVRGTTLLWCKWHWLNHHQPSLPAAASLSPVLSLYRVWLWDRARQCKSLHYQLRTKLRLPFLGNILSPLL